MDAKPGGREWRAAVEALAGTDERHLFTFEGHVADLTARDRPLLDHIDTRTMVGDIARIGRKLSRLGDLGYQEVIYTPTGPDVPRELRAFVTARALA
ncbi:hypothetical protein [Streptomyces sp. B21-083]|uniref:hypothetical protein n=1 Tax=Streptomyces sp. B21-083 TaxID=3039410 RepID=UPI002FF2F79B